MSIYKKINGRDVKVAENSIIDHSQLSGTKGANCHPISAIRNLPEKLTNLKNRSIENSEAIQQNIQAIADNADAIRSNTNSIDNLNTALNNVSDALDREIIKRADDDTAIENKAKGISLTAQKDGQGNPTGKLIFQPYEGQPVEVQGGFLPDDDTIKLTNNKIALKKVYVDSDTIVGDGSSLNTELNAKAIKDNNGTITVSDIVDMNQEIQAIEGRGGYLRPYDFETTSPDLYTETSFDNDDTDRVLISSLNKMFDANGNIVPYVSGEGELITSDAIEYGQDGLATSNSILSILTQYALQEIGNDKNAVEIFNGTRVTNLENNHT